MPTPRPWAILFDLDGTLVDTTAFLLRSMRHAFEGFPGRHPSDEEWVAGIGTPLRTQLRAFAPSDEAVEALVTRYRSYQKAHHDAMTFAFPGAVALVAELKRRGHPTAIVTSKGTELAQRTCEHVGLAPHIDVLMTADTSPRHKPDPMPVQLALEKLDRTPDEAVFIGDSTHDVASGNAAGVISIAALWGPFPREALERAKPRHMLARLDEILPLVERLSPMQPVRAEG